MSPSRFFTVAATFALALVRIEDAAACSCVGPRDVLVGPDRADDAPLGSHVRLEMPWGSPLSRTPVLRVTDAGAAIETTSQSWQDGTLRFVDLAPKSALAPSTRYEIAIVDAAAFPSTVVIGTFKTGTTTDTTAPRLDAVGVATAHGNAHAGGGDCSITGPWIDIGPIKADDPGRPNAKLLYAIWVGDAAGNVDTAKPPTALSSPYQNGVTVGKRSLCDPHDVALPKSPFVALAIAAVDESGNKSAPKRLRVDMRSVPGAHP